MFVGWEKPAHREALTPALLPGGEGKGQLVGEQWCPNSAEIAWSRSRVENVLTVGALLAMTRVMDRRQDRGDPDLQGCRGWEVSRASRR